MLKKLVVRKKQGVYVFPIEDIVYMEKDHRKICLHTMDHAIEFYGKFTEVMPFLDERFMYCHRSYVINMDQIIWMQYNEIFVSNNERIPMGRNTYGRAKKIFTQYMTEKAQKNH